jgi:Icc protein
MNKKNLKWIKYLILVAVLLAVLGLGIYSGTDVLTQKTETFRFVFVTDIHLQPDERSVDRFNQAVVYINNMKPKPRFVITGGDLIENSFARDFESADKLYNLYQSTCKKFDMPVYDVIGNNDVLIKGNRPISSRIWKKNV